MFTTQRTYMYYITKDQLLLLNFKKIKFKKETNFFKCPELREKL